MSHRESAWLTRLEESFQDELFLYMVMEYMPGGDLGSLDPDQEGIPEDQARFYAAELVLALDELHRMGYVHRDVKPGNVMIREDGHVRLADFGSAGRLDSKTGLVFSKSSVGTPDYISPEALEAQQTRNGAYYGAESDWWGLGVTLYELLTGSPPFFAPSLVQTYTMIAAHEKHLNLDDARISAAAKSLLRGLLCDKIGRLNLEGIKAHPFFDGIEWDELQLAVPPFIPILESPEDTSRFYLDDDEDDEEQRGSTDLQIAKKKVLVGFEGVQFPFVGYTFDSTRSYKVAWDALPVLQRMESCQIRMGELESQLTEMRQSCETAKLVNEQIKRIASCDELPLLANVSSDDLQAAYDALMQNYDFLQMHYEELLREHDRTSRQLEALLSTMQEQETARVGLEDELAAQNKRTALDKLKIGELVNKLATLAMRPSGSTTSKDGSDLKKQLKRLQQDYKCLEQQLDKETRSRVNLEEELAELKISKATLEQEHESLLIELRSGAVLTAPKLERKSSDVGSILRSLVKGHSRQPSISSSLQNCSAAFDGPVKILEPKLSRRRELQWTKSHLAIRETGLWIGDREASMCLLGTLKADVFWAQPVQPGELLGLPTSKSRNCFKIRFLLAAPPQEQGASAPSDVEARLEKEQKILRGAQQLLEAARTPEQKAIAQSHVDASQRLITSLQQQRDTNTAIDQTLHTWIPASIDEPVCDGCLFPGATLRCPTCDAHCHQHCHAILPITCQHAALLMHVQPAFVQVTSADDVRKWIRAMETARRIKS